MSVISSKNQITIPVETLRAAGLEPGDDVRVISTTPGRIELVKTEDLIERYAGSFDETVYPAGYLDEERRGWE